MTESNIVDRERIPTESGVLTLEVSQCRDVSVIYCKGELDTYTAPWLHELTKQRLTANYPSLIIDLTEVDFLDACSLGKLIWIHEHSRKLQGNICLVVAKETNSVRRVLEITGLDKFFDHQPSVEEALHLLS